MFILQTTTAVLIAFLAVIAYNEIRNRIAKGRSRRKDLETPGSPTIAATNDAIPPVDDGTLETSPIIQTYHLIDPELERYKQLYYKLHHLEHHPEILPECRELLLGLLSSTIADAAKEPHSGILTVEQFSRDRLNEFLKAKDVDVTNRWEEYLTRRRAGGSREMFSDKEEAKWWLKQAAPVKYVDGAWLGHINKISTPFKYRQITKNAWQVMSEELGDGDLAKNHVQVYRELMEDIEAGLPAADSEDFIHPRHDLTEARCWKAAMAQLTISLFPHEFLPEALGFNMAYESLPLHLLKTVKELRELRLNPYYFELHISIDNADSGHAAMAMAAVTNYIELVAEQEGEEAVRIAWKRVQADYILAEGLPTTPESPSLKVQAEEPFPRTGTEAALVDIFAAKSFVAHKIHCNSRLKIGRRSLVDWLEPNAFKDAQWQKEFVQDLSNCKPWVIKGDSEKSRLVKELSWEGKMFGSFTEKEVEVVKAWIDELGSPVQSPQSDPSVYFDFTGQSSSPPVEAVTQELDILTDYPVLATPEPTTSFATSDIINLSIDESLILDFSNLNLSNLLPLWLTSPTLLEALPAVPVRAADMFGSAIVRVLRAQTGFSAEGPGVAGMDEVHRTDDGHAVGLVELGLRMCRREGLHVPVSLKEGVALGSDEIVSFSQWMAWMGMRWLTHRDVLVGMAWAFMEMHEALARWQGDIALLDEESRNVLQEIAVRERTGLDVCREAIFHDQKRTEEFSRGLFTARRAIKSCFT
ncbi:uncharacterized protein J4E88_010255 [Alternaria novae-zelandiae]|uniref:uncharacterized protein n=1 Tax=Alternaria novae-zelandiae TaxID=430562 RepID=UPI0020C316DE|nr:uncharacterized protein J4E88_010255 [Alternaria novae-zelandiae]KAI4667591.1 hypothetical protein J4E88_010255 [Alternaria novae-zelandiae]